MTKIFCTLTAAGLITLTAAFPALAAPIVYVGHEAAGSATADYSIKTDGTLGTLSNSNILSYNITLSNGTAPFSFSNTDGQLFFDDPILLATGANLTFDFSFNSELEFTKSGSTNELAFYGNIGGGFVRIDAGGFSSGNHERGLQTIATVQAVPEPAAWAMMIAGFGMVGSALRRYGKVSSSVRFA